MIGYTILGISSHKLDPEKDDARFSLYVAWQSNLPGYKFAWRCTYMEVDCVTQETVQGAAARGRDVDDTKLVNRLFPFFNIKQLSD